jgi:hypothetical protein
VTCGTLVRVYGESPHLFGTLGVLIVLFFIFEGQRNGRKISPQSLGILVKAKNAILIDLRDAKISVKVTSVVVAIFHIAKLQVMLMN